MNQNYQLKKGSANKSGKKHLFFLRIFFLLASIGIQLHANFQIGLSFLNHFKYMTMWSFFLSIIFYATSIIETIFAIKGTLMKKINKISFIITFSTQLAVTVVYWGVIHFELPKEMIDKMFYFLVFTHSFVLLFIWIDFTLNEIVIELKDINCLIGFLALYQAVNYGIFWTTGEVIYRELNYEDISSLYFILGTLFCFMIHFFIGMAYSSYFKRKVFEKKEK